MKRQFVHVPYRKLKEVKKRLLELGISPEIYFSALDLEEHEPAEIIEDLAPLKEQGLSFTIHAPFMDLNPGSVDPAVRGLTLKRWLQLKPVVESLQAFSVVVHPGFDHWRYGNYAEQWVELAAETILELIKMYPSHVTVAVENIFERDPRTIKALLERVNHPRVGHCFDVGHFLLFSKVDLETWFAALGSNLVELHLHDNQGDRDSHMGIGTGIAPWDRIFSLVEKAGTNPLLVIEAHTEADALISLEFMKSRGYVS